MTISRSSLFCLLPEMEVDMAASGVFCHSACVFMKRVCKRGVRYFFIGRSKRQTVSHTFKQQDI
jgi:hypothetical protein